MAAEVICRERATEQMLVSVTKRTQIVLGISHSDGLLMFIMKPMHKITRGQRPLPVSEMEPIPLTEEGTGGVLSNWEHQNDGIAKLT